MKWWQLACIVALMLVPASVESASTDRWACNPPDIIAPGHAISVTCPYQRAAHARADVIALDRDAAATTLLRPYAAPAHDGTVLASVPLVWDAKTQTSSATFPVMPPGTYEIHVMDGATRVWFGAASVSSIGLGTIHTGNTTLLVPVLLDSYRVSSNGVRASLLNDTNAVTPLSDGLFQVNPHSEAVAELDAADGSSAYASVSAPSTPSPPILMQSDRPIYRPGDTVHLRAILRHGDVGAYTIPRAPVTLMVETGYPQQRIATRTLHPDRFGTIHTSLALPSDAPLGQYVVTIGKQWSGAFSVEAYRKPEYSLAVTPENAYPIGGDTVRLKVHAAYLFGAPAAGFSLQYQGAVSGGYRWWFGPLSPFIHRNGEGSFTPVSGNAQTDAQGDATIVVPTTHKGFTQQLNLDVDARDESGRTITQRVALDIQPATFALELTPRSWFARPGATALVDVTARRYDGALVPHARIRVHIVQTQWQNGNDRTVDRGSVDLVTGADGKALFSWIPPESGSYEYEATSTDERGNAVTATQYQWIVDPSATWLPTSEPALIPQKSLFEPGEPAHLLLTLQHAGSDAVLVVSTDHPIEQRVLHHLGTVNDITVVPPHNVTQILVSVFVPERSGLASVTQTLAIDPKDVALRVAVRAQKAQYRPGEHALFHVHVTDAAGRPRTAELSVGVVDQGIYLLSPDTTDPLSTFYTRSTYAWGSASWSPPMRVLKFSPIAETVQDTYMAPAATPAPTMAPSAMQPRSNFLDTAYWTPAVVTDTRGDATVSFSWPDNLTTWVTTATGVTTDTKIGRGTLSTLVTKPFLVRLATPRFARAGDRVTLVGIAQGERAGAAATMTLHSPQLAIADAARHVLLAGTKRARAAWPVQIPGVGTASLVLRGSSGAEQDALEASLPLLAGTPAEHVRSAGTLQQQITVPTTLESGEMAGPLALSFSPSLLAELAQTLREFDVYPYFCTEQTGSNALVAAAFVRAARMLHGVQLSNHPQAVIRRALVRLRALHHGDGGWGWWSQDKSNVFMTAYAVWTLQAMRDAGGSASADPLLQDGERWLNARLTDAKMTIDPRDRAFALFAIANAGGSLPSGSLDALFRSLDSNDATAVAFAGLAANAEKRDDLRDRAVQMLLQTAIAANGVMYWRDGDWSYEWWSDPVGATSYAAMLLERAGDRAHLDQALGFLRAQRQGDWWFTTADTAAAATALSYAEAGAGAPGDNVVRVKIGDRVVRTLQIDGVVPDASATHIVLAATEMQSHEPVTIDRSGSGPFYWSSDFTRYLNRNATVAANANRTLLQRLFAKPPALSVNRRFTVDHPGPWRIGDLVTVDLWITAPGGAQYVTLEDPHPAGLEYQPAQGEAGNADWSGAQYLDDRAAFFFQSLWPGQTVHLRYQLRATTAGTFAAPGPSAYASYGPPVSAIGTGEEVVIQ